jgi:hypothetical protein
MKLFIEATGKDFHPYISSFLSVLGKNNTFLYKCNVHSGMTTCDRKIHLQTISFSPVTKQKILQGRGNLFSAGHNPLHAATSLRSSMTGYKSREYRQTKEIYLHVMVHYNKATASSITRD